MVMGMGMGEGKGKPLCAKPVLEAAVSVQTQRRGDTEIAKPTHPRTPLGLERAWLVMGCLCMSKAFTKESDGADDDAEPASEAALPGGFKNYITPAGYKRLSDERVHLWKVERPK